MSRFRDFVVGIHHRSLWQVLGIYLAGSWVVLQLADTFTASLGLPDWVPQFSLVLLIVLLPVVLATAFVQEGVSPKRRQRRETGPGAPAAAFSKEGRHYRFFTWRNALLAAAGALILFAVGTTGFVVARTLGIGPAATLVARGVLDEQATVVLADFEAADQELAEAATEALRVDLSQSEAIQLAGPADIRDALQRMEREATEPLTSELAREVAQREGAAAVIVGDINRAGTGYVFSAQIATADDGEILTLQRETAADSTQIIAAIDRLSKKLRERIGESLLSIRATEPLEQVTTANLEALKLFSRASREGEFALYERAVALDTAFAMAWRSIAIRLRNIEIERARAVDAFSRAFRHRDRLTARERHLTAASYYGFVTYELDKAALEYEALLVLNPDDPTAVANLGVTYSQLRDFRRSEELSLRTIALQPGVLNVGYHNTLIARINQGKFEDAQAILDSLISITGRQPWRTAFLASAQGKLEEGERILREVLANPAFGPGAIAWFSGDLATVTAGQGRLAEASEVFRNLRSAIEQLDGDAMYLKAGLMEAWTLIVLRGDTQGAVRQLDDALSRYPLSDMHPLDRPYAELTELLARAGEVERATALMTELEEEVAVELRRGMQWDIDRATAEIALAEGRHDEAIRAFRRADKGFCVICVLPGLALAYEAAGERDSAIAVHERYALTPYSDRFTAYTYGLGPALGPTYERLGRLYDDRAGPGDLENAARFYAMFVDLWASADSEFQPRVEAAQARLEEIVRERG